MWAVFSAATLRRRAARRSESHAVIKTIEWEKQQGITERQKQLPPNGSQRRSMETNIRQASL